MSADASGTLFRQKCEFCGAAVNTLRRGRCWGCYQRWQQAQPVGKGASCVVCGERRNDNLQRVELFGRWLPMCHICASRTRRLQPMPASIPGIREALRRERRQKERRRGKPDTRLDTKDRRGPDRRAVDVEEADIISVEDLGPEDRASLNELALELSFAPAPGDATTIWSSEQVARYRENATTVFERVDDEELVAIEKADDEADVLSGLPPMPPPRKREPSVAAQLTARISANRAADEGPLPQRKAKGRKRSKKKKAKLPPPSRSPLRS